MLAVLSQFLLEFSLGHQNQQKPPIKINRYRKLKSGWERSLIEKELWGWVDDHPASILCDFRYVSSCFRVLALLDWADSRPRLMNVNEPCDGRALCSASSRCIKTSIRPVSSLPPSPNPRFLLFVQSIQVPIQLSRKVIFMMMATIKKGSKGCLAFCWR